MSQVFNINEELACIAVTSTELASITNTMVKNIRNKDFIYLFSSIINEVNQSYAVLNNLFSPFCNINNETLFKSDFDEKHKFFKDNYLMEISKPRKYCDNVYDSYVEMQQTKESKTGFPLIKNNFLRLNKLYDKWISNDCYLGMSIDRAAKLENNLLTEIANLKIKDSEDAFINLLSSFEDFNDYLEIIRKNHDKITQVLVY